MTEQQQQEQPPKETVECHDEDKLKLGDIIKGITYAMVVTVDHKDGLLRGRLMSCIQNGFDDEEGCLWFFTKEDSAKVEELQKDSKCNVMYTDTRRGIYVTVTGTGTILDDIQKVDELWEPFLEGYFPDGPSDPQLRLLKIKVCKAEFWDVYSSTLGAPKMIYQTLKSVITGYPDIDLSVSQKLNISSSTN